MIEPTVWWMGLFASPGGLLIVGLSIAVLILTLLLVRCHFVKRKDTRGSGGS